MPVVVVESPAKAKTINGYLGPDYTVLASFGHVRDLPPKDGSVDPEADFAMTWEVAPDSKKHLRAIKDALKDDPALILATDPDREGEAIAWHVAEAAGADPKRTQRVVFHEITKNAVADAFAHARQIDFDLVNAQQTRRILDRLVGYQVSPLLWKSVRGGLSAGRVQTVAVRLIVERERVHAPVGLAGSLDHELVGAGRHARQRERCRAHHDAVEPHLAAAHVARDRERRGGRGGERALGLAQHLEDLGRMQVRRGRERGQHAAAREGRGSRVRVARLRERAHPEQARVEQRAGATLVARHCRERSGHELVGARERRVQVERELREVARAVATAGAVAGVAVKIDLDEQVACECVAEGVAAEAERAIAHTWEEDVLVGVRAVGEEAVDAQDHRYGRNRRSRGTDKGGVEALDLEHVAVQPAEPGQAVVGHQ